MWKNTHFRDITHSVWPSCASSKSPQAQSVASGPLVHTMTTYSYKSTLFCKFEHSGVLDCHHYPSLRLKVQSAFHQWKQRPLQHEHQILRSLGLSMLHSISFRLLGRKEWQAHSVLQTSIIDSETLAASSNACCSICLGRTEWLSSAGQTPLSYCDAAPTMMAIQSCAGELRQKPWNGRSEMAKSYSISNNNSHQANWCCSLTIIWNPQANLIPQ